MNDILFGNNNSKVITKLSKRYFKKNKVRNLAALLAIILTAFLFTSITSLAFNMASSIQLSLQMQKGSKADGTLGYMTEKQYEQLVSSDFVDQAGHRRIIGYASNTSSHSIEINYEDSVQQELTFCVPTHGAAPEKANEIATTDLALKALGVEPEIGAEVPLEFELRGKTYHYDMVLSGWWEASNDSVSVATVSEQFIKENPDVVQNTYAVDHVMSGVTFSDVVLKNKANVQQQLNEFVYSIGGNPEDMGADNFILASENQMSQGLTSSESIVPAVVFILMFVVCGYLLIYNIFDISVMQDVRQYGLLRTIKTSEDGQVAGINFTITGEGYSATKTTNEAGEIDITDLNPGVYTVTEQSIEKYEPQETQRVTIVSGQTATVTFNNKLKRGSLEVTKTSEDGLVEGMTFHLSGTSLSGQPVDEYAVTDGNGVARFENVLIGTGYVLEEVDTPVRYVVPNSQTATIEWNEVTHKSVNNVLKKFRVTVTKSDVETGAPQGDGSLAGAVYGLYKGDTLIDSFTTDENGQFTTGYYVCDSDWTIREISPSEGYLLDSTIHKVGAEPELYTIELNDTANDVTEQVIKGDIAIIKHTDDGETQIETPESGAEFQVFLKSAGSYENAKESERDVLVCDENGFAQSKKLPYGTYIVRQTKGWEGRELMDDFEVYIAQDGQTYRYLINNANFESFIKVVKVDAETGVTIPYAGAGFQIYRPDGSKVEMTFTYPTPTTIDTFYTNSEGYLVTPEKLEYGTGYSLVEVQAPYGYVLDSTPVYFDVTEDNSSEEGGVTVIEVTKPNMAQKGIIKVSKTGEVFSSVAESEGIYQPVYEVQGLPGAVFEITALEDVYTLDGTLRYSAGEVVDTITTGEDGTAQSQPFYLGKFQVKEIQFPHGMVDTGENVTNVELVYAGQEVEVTETFTSFYNQRQKALVTLNKVLEQDETFGIGMNGEISAVTFGLYAQEDITAADGSVIPADGLLEIVSVNENGQAICSTDLPFGSFYLKELSTDSHYLLNGETFPFTFEYGGPSIAVVEISANDGEAVTNELIRGEIKGLKTDENGTGLGGAVIGLFKSDETEFTAENALATATSAEDGSFSFTNVPYGDWVLKELESPEGFILSDEVIPVTVEEDGQVVEISLANERVYGDLRLTKVDKDYPDNKLTGAEFEVYRDTNGNKELDEGDELLGKLEETSTGIYEMSHILYGGVFVRETKAPEGFLLDENAYYVEITENGKIYEVENEAGVGFTNMAQTGSLRIEKTSSDGKVEGFSFRVTGANGYDQTFKTDKNGEIFIEGLRVGDYTVSEVSDGASANYVLPADKKVTILADKTTVAQMHNELRDTPKTGDDSKPWLWAALMGVSAMGAAALGVAAYVGKRKKGKNTVK